MAISVYGMMFFYVFLLCLIFNNKHTLMSMLICLELMMFLLLCFIMYTMTPLYGTTTLLVLLMCFIVNGAAIGLTLLVSMSRLYGNDKIANLLFEETSWNSDYS